MKPFLSSAFSFALLFSAMSMEPARAAEGGKEKAGQMSPAEEADGKAFAAAEALYAEAQYAEAEKECRAVLALSERALGAEHLDTLDACYHLAIYLGVQKKNPEALKYAQRAYAGRQKVLGRDHEDTQEANELVERLTKPETKA